MCDRAVVEEPRVKSCHRWVTVTGPGAGKRSERGQFGHAVLENELHARARALELVYVDSMCTTVATCVHHLFDPVMHVVKGKSKP